MSDSSSPSQAPQAQSIEYINYFSDGNVPYYSSRCDSYANPYHIYGNSNNTGTTPGPYYTPTSFGTEATTNIGSKMPSSSTDYSFSSYYVAAAVSQYYPTTNSNLNYTTTNVVNYGSSSSGTNQTLYHLSSHLPPSSVSASVIDSSTDSSFHLESQKHTGRKSINRGRGKPRRNSDSPIISNDINRVFIWDLDETIIIYHSLLTGTYARRYSKDINRLHRLGQSMEDLIFRVADNNFFFNDLEECDQVHIDDVSGDDNGQDLNSYNFASDGFRTSCSSTDMYVTSGSGVRGGVEWMRKLSFRFRKIKEGFNLYRNNIGELLGSPKHENWFNIIEELELQTNGWYSTALKCLKLIGDRTNCINILVTQTQLVEALTKVLLFQLGPIFQIENLYSASKVGKNACFDRITQRFGKKNITYVVIGDGKDEEGAAKNLSYPYWRITEHKDLDALYNALKLDYI